MTKFHVSRQAMVVTQQFAEIGLISVVLVVSAITAVTLIYVWFIA